MTRRAVTLEGLELRPHGAHAAGKWHVRETWSDGSTSLRQLATEARSGHAALYEAAAIARSGGLVLQTVLTEKGEVHCG